MKKTKEMELKNVVREQIIDCMQSFVNSYQNKEIMYQRLDELFLLWGRLENQNFVKSIEDFGLVYKDFNDKHYEMIFAQIIKQYPERLPDD